MSHLFTKQGQIVVEAETSEDRMMEIALDAGAEDGETLLAVVEGLGCGVVVLADLAGLFLQLLHLRLGVLDLRWRRRRGRRTRCGSCLGRRNRLAAEQDHSGHRHGERRAHACQVPHQIPSR